MHTFVHNSESGDPLLSPLTASLFSGENQIQCADGALLRLLVSELGTSISILFIASTICLFKCRFGSVERMHRRLSPLKCRDQPMG